MAEIVKNRVIQAPLEQVWAALTDPRTIGEWMLDSLVEVDLQVGGKYAFFGGETTGTFTAIAAPNRLEYTWRQSGWKNEWADSNVRWELRRDGNSTQVQLTHDQFPNQSERDSHDEGWDTYWLEPMQTWLEGEQ
jgi:uncharacterized protein YndB with AHSA1/START domain